MAIIKCKECGKEISDKADTCVHCGCPISKEQQKNSLKVKNIYIWLVVLLPLLSCLLLWITDYFINSFLISLLIAVIFITVLEIVLILKDYKNLNKAKVDTSSLGEISPYKINIPKYITRRAKILQESSLKFIIWLLSFIIFIVIIVLEFNPLKYFDNSKYIKELKEETLNLCSDYTVEELINNYMKNPEWNYEKKNGKKIVSIKGEITYLDKDAEGLIEFYIEDEEFKFYKFKIDGKTQSEIMSYSFLENLCENMNDNNNISNDKNNDISEEDIIVSFKDGKKISKEEYYKELKNNGSTALNTLVNMVDKYIYEKEFASEIENAKKEAEAQVETLKNYYDSDEEMEQAIQNAGFGTIETYKKYVYISYLQNHAVETYAKSLITEIELRDYYKNNVYPNMNISHILITPKSSSSATSDEKKKAEEVIKRLKESKDVAKTFEELAKEYSDDNTYDLDKINIGSLNSKYDELVKAAAKLKDGEFSTEPIVTELGYEIILKTKTYEKASYNDSLESMKEKIANKKLEEDRSLVYEAVKYYFKKYDVEIHDEELEKEYNKYMEEMKKAY